MKNISWKVESMREYVYMCMCMCVCVCVCVQICAYSKYGASLMIGKARETSSSSVISPNLFVEINFRRRCNDSRNSNRNKYEEQTKGKKLLNSVIFRIFSQTTIKSL